MRQLWVWGWMPNYLRHVVASFLVEHLGLDWRHGAAWFHDTLADADAAINAYMWQNGGRSGMDQWGFVMHPVNAAKSCDPDGDYVRRWVPELAKLPKDLIHSPWDAPATLLANARLRLVDTRRGAKTHANLGFFGDDRLALYPQRIVADLDRARRQSHDAVMRLRKNAGDEFLHADGSEMLHLEREGRSVKLITRKDFRQNEARPVTFQTPDEFRDSMRRAPQDTFRNLIHQDLRRTDRDA